MNSLSLTAYVYCQMIDVDPFVTCSHKVYMKIQELMMKKLALPTWEEVEQACPLTSSYKALEEFFIVFREWVSVKYTSTITHVHRKLSLPSY